MRGGTIGGREEGKARQREGGRKESVYLPKPGSRHRPGSLCPLARCPEWWRPPRGGHRRLGNGEEKKKMGEIKKLRRCNTSRAGPARNRMEFPVGRPVKG
jgi:hypothetical protein